MIRYVPDQDGKIWDVGAAGLVVYEGRVLLIRHTYGVGKGIWSAPGGYARHDERLDEAAVREVYEETGVRAEVLSLVGVRTRYVPEGGAVFVFFRMRPLKGDPRPDGVEVDRAVYFSAEEIAALDTGEIFSLSRQAALAALRGSEGLVETPCPP
ncbi:MAG: NUDIX domain-containing protein, partial [Anaerolineae bacterium]